MFGPCSAALLEIFLQIVEFPGLSFRGDELPLPLARTSISLVLKKEGLFTQALLRLSIPVNLGLGSGYLLTAATTEISTKSSARAIRASTQARAGAYPSGTQASQTAFMAAKSFMSRT